eukprot:comp18425_c0_seq1/m.19663 comp18425_c0_seq1/g.19663  ORF comp18425_c0_seq1/g.19663 comp18425_c0_seq1/m.19663 type:complete len:320 (-) comp18425_c0_seq1:231-1190(-)
MSAATEQEAPVEQPVAPVSAGEGAEEEKKKKELPLGPDGKPMSKNALKRLLKDQKWEANREKRKEKRKQKKMDKKERKRAGDVIEPAAPRKKFKHMSDAKEKFRVVIDADWESYMSDADIKKVLKQTERSYSANRRSDEPLQYYVTSIGHRLRALLDKEPDSANWDINLKSESYLDVFNKDELVYLSSESPNVLTELDTSKVYIIGGLVDHNHHKGVAYQRAIDQGIGHAQLPIGDYIKLASRKVLTINHVFEILLEWVATRNWQTAFLKVIPERKGIELLDSDTGKNENTTEDGEKEEKSGEEEEGGDESSEGENGDE